jgi:autotransporter-associated beta strand protein
MKPANLKNNSTLLLFVMMAGLFAVPVLHAAGITWNTPVTISGDTDVATSGALVYAYDESNLGATVNTVAFAAGSSTTSLGGGNVTLSGVTGGVDNSGFGAVNSAPMNTLSGSYSNILKGGAWTSSATTVTVTLNNLTSGHQYLVQIWVDDSRSYGSGRTETVTSSGGNTVTLSYNSTGGTGGVGKYAIGTFTANATTQAFTLSGNTSSQLDTIQVRDITGGFFSGASGTVWDASTTSDWGTTSGGPYAQTWSAASGGSSYAPATFEGTANTVNVNGAVTAGGITFTTDGYTLAQGTSGQLTLSGGGITTGSGSDTIGAVLAGTVPVAKYGSGQLTLSGANTFSGGMALLAGQLNINNGGSSSANSAIGTGTLTISGGTIDNTSSGDVTLLPNNAQNWNGDFTYAGSVHNLNFGAGAVTLGANRTVTVSANTLTVGGSISGSACNLTKAGAGTLALSGGGSVSALSVLNGILTITSGTLGSSAFSFVGDTASQTGVASVSSGATLNFNQANGGGLGYASAASGAIYNSGTFGATQFYMSDTANNGSYGYIQNAGTMTINNNLWIGRGNNESIVDVVAGGAATIGTSGGLNLASAANAMAGLNITGGGTFTDNKSGDQAVINGGSGAYTSINISGSGSKLVMTGGSGFNLNNENGASTSIFSLASGGEFDCAYTYNNQSVSHPAIFNFNNGTYKATAANGLFEGTAGATLIYIYSGGATINNNGFSSTINSGLLAPTADGTSTYGVTGITLGGTDTGYIGAPLVKITGGGGQGAAAIATFNPATGTITGITVTAPGSGYTSTPTVTLVGGNGGSTGSGTGTATATASIGAVSSGGVTFSGGGTTTLSGGASTYTGNTTISGGTLKIGSGGSLASANINVGAGATYDVSTAGGTLAANQNMSGGGVVTGAVTTASSSTIYAGGVGTLSFSNNLTMTSGSVFSLDVSTSHSSGNDQVIVAGTLALNATAFHITALGGASALDTNADYVLVTAGSISGLPNSQITWIAPAPANSNNFAVVISGNKLVLHYTASTPPAIASATAAPTTVPHGQSTTITATVTTNSNPIGSVTVSSSAIVGSPVTLITDGAGHYTNQVTIAGSATLGSQTLAVVATDTQSLSSAPSNIVVTVTVASEIWNGNGSDNNWGTGANWVSGVQPLAGDSVAFAGSLQLTANMNSSFNLASLTFSNNAGSFDITNAANTLTLSGGLTNNSANAQTLDVPVALSGAQTLYLPAGNVTISRAVADSGAGFTLAGGGTLTLSGVNTFSGAATISAGTLAVGGAGQLGGGTYSAAIMDNGLFDFNSSTNQTMSGVISGTGALTKDNSGTLTLSGTNTYTGNTTINGGTLKLAAPAVLHLSFDNVSGTNIFNDGTGGSAMNGALYGSATIVPGGKFGNCLNITGANAGSASCRIASSVVPLNVGAGNNWTVAMWVRSSTAGGCYAYQGDGSWVGTYPTVGNTAFYLNNGSGAGAAAGGVRWGQAWESGTATVNDGSWHHVVFECNGTTKTAYVDGNVDALTSDSWSAAGSGGQFWIGGGGDTGDGTANLNGQVDEVYVFNRTLSQTEVQQLYNNNAITPVLPTNATVSVASGATLDMGGVSQQLASLTGSGNVALGVSSGAAACLTLGTAGNMEFDGVISGSSASTVTKVGTGQLVLGGANTCAGNTIISAGTLALSGSGSISNSANIIIGGGAKFDVSALSSTFALGSGQTLTNISGTGILAGNVNLNAGSLVLNYTNGTPSLNVTNGTLNFNNNAVTVNVLGTALPHGIYKLISTNVGGLVSGTLPSSVTVNGIGTSPGSLSISNGELYLIVNHPPVAAPMTVTRTAGLALLVALSDVAANWSDADGDTVTLTGINLVTTNGVNLMTNASWILYTNSPNVNDQISYGITDGFGGTNIGYINIVINSSVTGTNSIASITTGSTNVIKAYGIPGYNYILERATNLAPAVWVDVSTNAAATNGVINAVDVFNDLGKTPPASAYYRLEWQP